MKKARFYGEYPFARVELEDSQVPLEAVLEAFNPFIPLKPENSGIPAVVLRFRLKNLSRQRVKATVVGSIMNPVGFDGEGDLNLVNNAKFGQNVNQIRLTPLLSGLLMSSQKVSPDSAAFYGISSPQLTARWEKPVIMKAGEQLLLEVQF